VERNEAAQLYGQLEDAARPRQEPARRQLRFDDDILGEFNKLGTGRRLLDIGSGDGRFLAAARNQGYDCVGTDVSADLAKIAAARSGAPVLVGHITDLDLPNESFDFVNFDQVLSYIPNPREVVRKAAAILRPTGVCRIREYNPDSLSARLKGTKYWMYGPTIVNVWTPQAVRALAAAANLRLTRVIAGAEASLASWRATTRAPSLRRRLCDPMLFLARRVRILGVPVAADTAYYLQKPSGA
jgi:SAM-dependent methyltransferase